MNARLIGIACAIVASASHAAAQLGGLNPPAGPIQNTGPDLGQVEPRIPVGPGTTPGGSFSQFTISQPGSYYLTGDLVGVSGRSGIFIESSGVSLDLNGFEVRGVSGSGSGIVISGFGIDNVRIFNGGVRGWGQTSVSTFNGTGVIVRDLTVSDGGRDGIGLGLRSLAESCTVNNCAGDGISSNDSSAILRCVIQQCETGISGSNGMLVKDCKVSFCDEDGIRVISGTVDSCDVGNVDRDGIALKFDDGVGITADGGVVRNCNVDLARRHGINVENDALVENNLVTVPVVDGIRCISECRIRGNTIQAADSGARPANGIRATGGGNFIENNHIGGFTTGLRVDVARSAIFGNISSGALTAYNIAASNVVGPVSFGGINFGPINGTSGGAPQGGGDPRANLAF